MTYQEDNINESLIHIALQKLENYPKKNILLKFINDITNKEAKKIICKIIKDILPTSDGIVSFNNDEDGFANRLIDKLSQSREEIFKIYATFPSANRVILPFNLYCYAARIMLFSTVVIFISLPMIIQNIPPDWMFLAVFFGGVLGASVSGVMAVLYSCKEYKFTQEIGKNTDNFLKKLKCLEDSDTTNYNTSYPQ